MLHEQSWLLVFVANLFHDKRKGELARDDGFEDSLEVGQDDASQRQQLILLHI